MSEGEEDELEQLSDDEARRIALRDHPKFRKMLDKGRLPDEITGPDGEPMNPRLHLAIHEIVERQLAADEPKGVVAIAKELEELGVSRHDIRHYIGMAVSSQLWSTMKHKVPFDEKAYFAELRETVESVRRQRER